MPAIEISTDQREYLDELSEALRERHVGDYGTVRPRDALQFLIDRHEADEVADGTDATAEADEAEAADGATDDGDGGAERLQAMMSLLDDHADKWEEADSDEGRYAVALPDGETEHVRTRDDVRALLFQHYR